MNHASVAVLLVFSMTNRDLEASAEGRGFRAIRF